ncbi:hypothetical protein RHMOL_Rhmol02G0242200 [Rhododendron molle]|uniref:Uncharacterized protein n=1 Tax=Rhododendron molle TaxID=49168 RepID=A0ACC0PUY4_RHOML|nr:hypothetical protein RHMOL_Rhmol02G0242200 [Rhododendron molle]
MKNPPPPLHSRYPPRKLLLFLLSNTHPAIRVMGNKNTTTLINDTDEDMEIREFRGIITGENNLFSPITVKARDRTNTDPTKFGGADSQGGQPSNLMICCGGSLLRWPEGNSVLRGERFINSKTVTIKKLEDQNSTGVVCYEVIFQPRDAADQKKKPRDASGSDRATSLKAMTLDPAKLFSSNIVDDPETSLLHKVLEYWPRTFTNFNSKDDLEKTVRAVNDLMVLAKKYNALRVQAKEYSADPLTGEAKVMEKVKEKVGVLNNLCAAKEE